MARLLISILIVLYAIAFAFGAMTAIRWPSLMMFASLAFADNLLDGLSTVDWRELGILYGAPYFLAALCFYASALTVSQRRKGGFIWYCMACISGFPCIFLVDFEAGWWSDPSAGEGAVAGAGAAAILLGLAVWLLRQRKPAAKQDPQSIAETEQFQSDFLKIVEKPVRPKMPPSAAIMRQRAHFAAEGRKMLERRRRKLGG